MFLINKFRRQIVGEWHRIIAICTKIQSICLIFNVFHQQYLFKLFQSSSESDSALEDSSSGEELEEQEDAITSDGPTKADQLVNLLKNVLSPSREDAQGIEKPL